MPPFDPREEALFAAVLERPAAERAPFLDGACQGDYSLRQRLDALLTAHEQSEGVLGEVASEAKATMKIEFTDAPDETVGQKIGRYKILEKVGEGGCGVVYVAWGKPAEVAEWKMKLSEFQPTTNVPEKNAQQP